MALVNENELLEKVDDMIQNTCDVIDVMQGVKNDLQEIRADIVNEELRAVVGPKYDAVALAADASETKCNDVKTGALVTKMMHPIS